MNVGHIVGMYSVCNVSICMYKIKCRTYKKQNISNIFLIFFPLPTISRILAVKLWRTSPMELTRPPPALTDIILSTDSVASSELEPAAVPWTRVFLSGLSERAIRSCVWSLVPVGARIYFLPSSALANI